MFITIDRVIDILTPAAARKAVEDLRQQGRWAYRQTHGNPEWGKEAVVVREYVATNAIYDTPDGV